MRSIKPGRAPSWGGVVGGIIGGIFGILWTYGAASMGAPGFFVAFGVVFVCVAIFNIFYSLHNATSRRRFSVYDITDDGEEPDPLDPRAGQRRPKADATPSGSRFCTACGTSLKQGFKFCPQCGKVV